MDKDKKKTCIKKSFVRNTERQKPKTVVINEQEKGKVTPEETLPKTKESEKKLQKESSTKFDIPAVNSAMMIAKKTEMVKNIKPRKVKSASTLPDINKLTVDEKITRKMNFPYDQPIYKGLIPLCTSKPQPQKVPSVIRIPLKPKDPEPKLTDSLTPEKLPEYKYTVKIEKPTVPIIKENCNFKLYKMMQNWRN